MIGQRDDSSRRLFLRHSAAPLLLFAQKKERTRKPEEFVYVLAAAGRTLRMTVDFFDNYDAHGLEFRTTARIAQFCLSSTGEHNSNCLQNFAGAVAVARYKLQDQSSGGTAMKEKVRTVDCDERLPVRPPYERRIQFEAGLASDIQAFGYESAAVARAAYGLWCVVRQDLFWNDVVTPFLVLHWKHTSSAIRLLDVIPAGDTRIVNSPQDL